MAWIYLAVLEDSQKPLKDTLSQSLTVKESGLHKPFSYQEWLQGIFPLLQYGMTLQPSGEHLFQRSTSFMGDSPVKTYQIMDFEQVWMESGADYFLKSSGSLANYDRDSSSWKMSQLLLFEELNDVLENFIQQGMTVDGQLFPLAKWAPCMKENDGGVWPTPQATDGMRIHFKIESHLKTKGFQGNIVIQAIRRLGGYPTPTFSEILMGYPIGWTALEDVAMQWFQHKQEKLLNG